MADSLYESAQSPGAPRGQAPGRTASPFSLSGVQGFASQDVSLHVGTLVLIALGVIVVLHIGGFRFAVDAGVARR